MQKNMRMFFNIFDLISEPKSQRDPDIINQQDDSMINKFLV